MKLLTSLHLISLSVKLRCFLRLVETVKTVSNGIVAPRKISVLL